MKINVNESKDNLAPVGFAKALADDTRQQIMRLCCCQWINVNQIVEAIGVSQPTVSHHLAILKEAGLVKTREEGKFTYYRLNQERIFTCCGKLIEVFAPDTERARQDSEQMKRFGQD
jgi:ArsR family transcriptional regulator